MLSLIFLLFQLGFAILFFYLCIAFVTGAPFVPSTDDTARSMIALSHIRKGDKVIDLGSGDGRLLLLAAAKGATARGVEINPYLVAFSALRGMLSPWRRSVSVAWGNLWSTDISDADVVYIYLLPWKMDKLKKRLMTQLKPGTRIVSNSFIFPDWKPTESDERTHAYLFTVPKKTS